MSKTEKGTGLRRPTRGPADNFRSKIWVNPFHHVSPAPLGLF